MPAIELKHGQDPAAVTNPAYWDCECKTDYIRPKQSICADPSKFDCPRCGASEDQQD
jgi:hypothetical protein